MSVDVTMYGVGKREGGREGVKVGGRKMGGREG